MASKKKEDKKENTEVDRIPVKAERPCFYDNIYRPEGDKFTVANENEISLGMDRMDGKPHPNPRKRSKEEEKPDPHVKELEEPETIKDAGKHII